MSDAALLDEPQVEEMETPLPNKYGYPEFAGYDGKRLLDRVLQQMLTYATWRTWHFSDEFVAPGNDCYVGPSRLAAEIRPGVRKVEMDFKALRDQGLLQIYPDYRLMKNANGQVQKFAVIIKDFTALYALAHEYYLWTISPGYIPPQREFVDLILQNEELTQKLIRFDNYRRLLCCKKPGRKPLPQYDMAYSHADLIALAAENAQSTASCIAGITGVKTKEYSNTSEKTVSPNRESKNPLVKPLKISISNSPKKEDIVAATAIGNSQVPTSNPSKSNPPSSTHEELGGERAKDVKMNTVEQKKMDAQAKAQAALADVIPAAHWQQTQQTRKTAAASRALAPAKERTRWQTPEWLVREVARQAQELHDDPKVLGSVVTRWSKAVRTIQDVYGIDPAVSENELLLLNKIIWARKRLNRRVRDINPKRRMPYLFECFLNVWEFTPAELLYLESDEPLYQDSSINDFVDHLSSSYERSGSRISFDEWAQAQLERERERKKKQR